MSIFFKVNGWNQCKPATNQAHSGQPNSISYMSHQSDGLLECSSDSPKLGEERMFQTQKHHLLVTDKKIHMSTNLTMRNVGTPWHDYDDDDDDDADDDDDDVVVDDDDDDDTFTIWP